MKWTVLVDNRTDDSAMETEHGLSILLETNHRRILLDTGASDLLIRNAKRLGVDLSTIDYVFISHGHSDHAGGLRYVMEKNNTAKIIVSPDAVKSQFFSKRMHLHSITTVWPEIAKERMLYVNESSSIDNDLQIMAHIPQNHPMPKGNQHLFVLNADGKYNHDDFRHELALYIDGLLFTGCAHSGLENILSACSWPVHSVVGGFHLLDGQESEEDLTALSKRLKAHYPDTCFYTSHCTGNHVFEIMKNVMGKQLISFSCGTIVLS